MTLLQRFDTELEAVLFQVVEQRLAQLSTRARRTTPSPSHRIFEPLRSPAAERLI